MNYHSRFGNVTAKWLTLLAVESLTFIVANMFHFLILELATLFLAITSVLQKSGWVSYLLTKLT